MAHIISTDAEDGGKPCRGSRFVINGVEVDDRFCISSFFLSRGVKDGENDNDG